MFTNFPIDSLSFCFTFTKELIICQVARYPDEKDIPKTLTIFTASYSKKDISYAHRNEVAKNPSLSIVSSPLTISDLMRTTPASNLPAVSATVNMKIVNHILQSLSVIKLILPWSKTPG